MLLNSEGKSWHSLPESKSELQNVLYKYSMPIFSWLRSKRQINIWFPHSTIGCTTAKLTAREKVVRAHHKSIKRVKTVQHPNSRSLDGRCIAYQPAASNTAGSPRAAASIGGGSESSAPPADDRAIRHHCFYHWTRRYGRVWVCREQCICTLPAVVYSTMIRHGYIFFSWVSPVVVFQQVHQSQGRSKQFWYSMNILFRWRVRVRWVLRVYSWVRWVLWWQSSE